MDVKYQTLSFQLMVEASPIALILVNEAGKVLFVNSFAEKLFEYKKNDLIGEKVDVLMPERYRLRHPELLKEYFLNPVTRQMGENRELFALKKTGEEFPVEIGLNLIEEEGDTRVLAAIIDITERKKADEQFRLVVESAPNAMVLANNSGDIVMVNKQTELLFGYVRDELVGNKVEKLIPRRFQKHHPNHLKNFYSQPQARPMGAGRDLFGIRKDGVEMPIEIGLNPLEVNGEEMVLASIIDITERKKNEDEIRLYTKRLEDKNKELEQFTYIASHDLREPLNSIMGLTKIMVEDGQELLDKEALRRLNFISQSSIRMRELVTGLLDYARIGKDPELTQVDLNYILAIVLTDLEVYIQRSAAEIKVDELPTIIAMEVEIRLLFQNLISNALKYSDKSRKLKIHITSKKVKRGWEFAVHDNGIGIPEDQKHKIFILFQRLHARSEYEGIGIGLSHCRKIVELHDGRIWVDSELGKGSTFYFFIPSR